MNSLAHVRHLTMCGQFLTTRKQREAILRLFWRTEESIFVRDYDGKPIAWRGPNSWQYKAFRLTVHQDYLNDCLMVNMSGMFIGIERDGYTHS